MKALKQIGFKLIVILCVVSTFCCFVASTPVNAASKVKTNEFYYSGTNKGSYVVDKGFLEKLVDALGAILDYLLGIMSLFAGRIVFIGWTELMERMLTWILEGAAGVEINVDEVSSTGLVETDDYITVEAIVFNHVPLFNINVFNFDVSDKYNSLGEELEPGEKSDIAPDSLITILKEVVAGWYYSFRLISIMVMLILLLYIGVKLAISSATKEKALYKQVLRDWLVGMILVFSIHYIILAMMYFNEMLVDEISKMRLGYKPLQAYEYGIKERAKTVTNSEMEISIYDEVRTRAYDAKFTVGTTGMIMYMVLVYYAWKFSFLYLKRYLVVAVLIMMAPFVAVSYAYNKVRTGKTVIFSNWFKELFFMIILQSIHALLYIIFFETALQISLSSIGGMIVAFVMLHFMTQAEDIFRKIFNVQGNLTSEVAGSKLKDIGKIVSNASLGIAGTKAAVGLTKASARAITKPIRTAGSFGFGKVMEIRANNLDKQNESSRRNGLATKKEKYEASEITRQNQLKLGEAAKNLSNRSLSDLKNLSDGERKALNNLRNAIPMASNKNKGQTMDEEEYIENFYQNKDQFAQKFDELTKKRAVFAHEVKTRWHEIMDPFQYVDKKDGKYKRIKTQREHENWGVLKSFSKKSDGASVILSKYMNSEYLLGLDSKQKAALKKQKALIKDTFVGFSGILLGLPLVVAEPAVGMAFLAKGISSNHNVWGRQGRVRKKNLKNICMTADGKYHLVGYAGNSVQTIANGTQAYARESYQEIEDARAEHNQQVVNRTKKHKKLYKALKVGAIGTVGGATTAFTLHTIAEVTAAPMVVGTVGGVVAGTALTGHFLGNLRANSYMAFQDTMRAARKQSQKDWEDQLKSTDSMLNYLAERYYEVEEQKKEIDADRHASELEYAYMEALEARLQNVEDMNDDELLRETEYEDDIEVEVNEPGVKQLSSDSEKKLIDNAIIEIIQKSGIINLGEYDLDNEARLSQVKKNISDKLFEKGILDKNEKAEDIIKDLDKKILMQKEQLEKKNPNAVQDKMVDDSIIEVMKEKDITDPNAVETGDVMQKFNEKYQKMADTPSEETSSAIDSLTRQKGQSSLETSEIRKSDKVLDEVRNTKISARKSIIAVKSERKLDEKDRKSLKDSLIKKKVRDLDKEILSNQIQIEEATDTSSSETIQSNAKTDDVIKMLQLQTQLHKDKERLEQVSSYTQKKGKERLKAYKAEGLLFNSDGSVRLDAYKDGSRKAVDTSRNTVTASELSVADIINKVKREKNI